MVELQLGPEVTKSESSQRFLESYTIEGDSPVGDRFASSGSFPE